MSDPFAGNAICHKCGESYPMRSFNHDCKPAKKEENKMTELNTEPNDNETEGSLVRSILDLTDDFLAPEKSQELTKQLCEVVNEKISNLEKKRDWIAKNRDEHREAKEALEKRLQVSNTAKTDMKNDLDKIVKQNELLQEHVDALDVKPIYSEVRLDGLQKELIEFIDSCWSWADQNGEDDWKITCHELLDKLKALKPEKTRRSLVEDLIKRVQELHDKLPEDWNCYPYKTIIRDLKKLPEQPESDQYNPAELNAEIIRQNKVIARLKEENNNHVKLMQSYPDGRITIWNRQQWIDKSHKYEKQLAEKDQRIAELEKSLGEAEQNIITADRLIDGYKAEIAELKDEIDKKEGIHSSLMQSQEKTIKQLKRLLKSKTDSVLQIHTKLFGLGCAIDPLTIDSIIITKLDELKIERKNFIELQEELKTTLEGKDEEIAIFKNDEANLKDKIEYLKRKIKKLKKKNKKDIIPRNLLERLINHFHYEMEEAAAGGEAKRGWYNEMRNYHNALTKDLNKHREKESADIFVDEIKPGEIKIRVVQKEITK